jgi:hypothetical protein
MRILFIAMFILLFAACSTKPGHHIAIGYNQKPYYVPDNCVYDFRDPNDPNIVHCFDKDKKFIVALHPMSNEEIKAYQSRQRLTTGFNTLINAFASGYNQGSAYSAQSTSQMQKSFQTINYKHKKPSITSIATKPVRYRSKSGKHYQYDLNRAMDRLQYSTDVSAQMRDMREPQYNKLYDYMDVGYGQRGGGVLE